MFFTPMLAAKTVKGEISRIYPNSNNVFFKIKNDTCNPNDKYYYFSMENENAQAWYSLILAAANTSAPINVRISNCPTNLNAKVTYIYQDF